MPGQAGHTTNSTPLHPASNRPPGSLNQVMFLLRSHGPRACWDPKRQGKVCKGFKAFPRSSRLRRRGAAHDPPSAAPDPGTRDPPGGRCPGSKYPPSPQALGVALPAPRWDSGIESIKKPLVHHKAHPSGSEGRGPRVPQEVPFHNLLRRPGAALSPETKSAVPLHLTFLLRWGEIGSYWRCRSRPSMCLGLKA